MTFRCWAAVPFVLDGEPTLVRCDKQCVPLTNRCAEHLIAHAAPIAPVAVGVPPEPAVTGATPK